MKKVKDIYFILIIVLGLVVISLYSTYALFTSETITTDNALNMFVGASYSLNIQEVKILTLPSGQGNYIELSFNNTMAETKNYEVYYEVLEGDSSSLEAGYSETTTYPVSGTIDSSTTKSVTVGFINNSTSDIVLKIGISTEELSSNQNTFHNAITIKKGDPIVETLTTLYTNATKTSVINNGVTYQYAKGVSMMTDVGGNIRYYGADPDNYIYFNCEAYPDTNCEKWRIIGIFDGKIKIMRNERIGNYSWDTSASEVNFGRGINQWGISTYSTDGSLYEGADLMRLLNPGHESNSINNSLYYNGGSGTCYTGQTNATSSCDFSETGLKNENTRNLISDSLYYLGGYESSSVYANQIYGFEREEKTYSSSDDGVNRTTTWTGKIALPYSSDYGYAADLTSCTVILLNYKDTTCTSTNWMTLLFGTSSYGWLINPSSNRASYAWAVNSSGHVYYANELQKSYAVLPTLYLNSDVIIDSSIGTGDVNSPYQIIIS